MREKLIRIRKAENGYILTIYFVGAAGERTVICQDLLDVNKALIHEFELTKNIEENIGNAKS